MVKKTLSFIFFGFLIALVFSAPASVFAQIEPAAEFQTDAQPRARNRGLLQLLNLTPDQTRQLRQINRERQTRISANQQRLRLANAALEEAMYADSIDESLIRERTSAVEKAQGAIIQTRTFYEMAVRRILNPAQLVRFRELRQQNLPRNQSLPGREQIQERREQRRQRRQQRRNFPQP